MTWNIGGEKAPSLKDLAAGEWAKYVCLEAALIGKPHSLVAGASFSMGQTFVAGAELPKAKKSKGLTKE